MVGDATIGDAALRAGFQTAGPGIVSGAVASPFAIAVAVAIAESSGDASARHVSAVEDSRGLWQINVKAHPTYALQNLYDPITCARAAYSISAAGTNWKPWSTYKDGTYKQFIPRAQSIEPGPGKDVLNIVSNPLGSAVGAGVGLVHGIVTTFDDITQLLLFLLDPHNLLRVALGIGGGALLVAGAFFLGKAVMEDTEIGQEVMAQAKQAAQLAAIA